MFDDYDALGKYVDLILNSPAWVDGADANLKPKEFALLFTLVQNEGRGVSAKELYEAVWNLPAANDTRVIWPHISKLKKKLAIDEGSVLFIESVYGRGYRFGYLENLNP
jgi:DNA-binding response OmpR family regulator